MTLMKIFLITLLLASICAGQRNPSHVLHGLFYDQNLTSVRYGSFDLDTAQLNIISSLDINDVGDPQHGRYGITPLTYDPNTDVAYMSAPNSQSKTILSVINATSGSLLRTFNSIEKPIISLQYDIFQKQLFAHVETDQQNVTDIVQIDTDNGKVKQVLGTLRQLRPTHISSYCPICRKYFLIAQQDSRSIYVGVNSTDGGGISWQTPVDFAPIDIKFDYKTFTMYTLYLNQTTGVFLLGILNRTIGGIGQVLAKMTDDPKTNVTAPTAYDVAKNLFYAFTLSTSTSAEGISYVDLNTTDAKSISLLKDKYNPYAWFIKEFVH